MNGTLDYKEYRCPCKGHITRRKAKNEARGLFNPRIIFIYFYECNDCGTVSNNYEVDITNKFK